MEPGMIRNESEYDLALARIDQLMSAKAGTPELDELKYWTLLVKAYEAQHYPIDLPDPISAIQFCMEQQGKSKADLIPYIGSKSRVSEVLSGKRALSLAMIRRLHKGLGIPLDILIQETKPKAQARRKRKPEPGAKAVRKTRATGAQAKPSTRKKRTA